MPIVAVPDFFLCPISLELMRDPVIISSGQTFERTNIEKWLRDGCCTCPVTRQVVDLDQDLIPNHTLRRLIQDWCLVNRSAGVERFPAATPAGSPDDVVRGLIKEIRSEEACSLSTLQKVTELARNNKASRKLLLEAGAIALLVSSLSKFGVRCPGSNNGLSPANAAVAEEILCILALICECENATQVWNLDIKQLSSIASFITKGSLDASVNAAILLARSQIPNELKRQIIGKQDLVYRLLHMIKHCSITYPRGAIAGLKLLSKLTSSHSNQIKVCEAGGLETLLELLPGASQAVAKQGIAVLQALCCCAEGRAAFCAHALSFPVTVKLISSPSNTVKELAVDILRVVLSRSTDRASARQAAVEAGAVLQLSIVAQWEGWESIRKKGKEVLVWLLPLVMKDKNCNVEYAFKLLG
eukprot:c10344_g1_i1 orf=206-1450(-)